MKFHQPVTFRAGSCAALLFIFTASAADVKLERVPAGGIQPQVAMGPDKTVHLLFFKGDPRGGNVFYTKKSPGQEKFESPTQVNAQPNSAIAIGTMRGPQLAVGKGGRIHVTWMGGEGAPKVRIGEKEVTGLWYSRMADDRKTFTPERNMLNYAAHLDGGVTVAADQTGHAYVVWHGSRLDEEGEENRAVYISRSADEGATFSREQPALREKTGACGCCGMRAFADPIGTLYILFRGAKSMTDRPQLLLVSNDHGQSFKIGGSSNWEIATCPASTSALFAGKAQTVGVWESREKVYWSRIDPNGRPQEIPVTAGGKQRHPAIATNDKGEVLVVWAEGTGWEKGGSLAWRQFDPDSKPLSAPQSQNGLPVWSFAAVYPEKDGSFTVLY